MSNKATTWRQAQKEAQQEEPKEYALKLKARAEYAIEYLERLRVERGCEKTLHVIVETAHLASVIHQVLHGPIPDEKEWLELEGTLLRTLRASCLDKSGWLLALWVLTLSVGSEFESEKAAA